MNEVKQVRCVEGSVLDIQKAFQLVFLMLHDKLIRRSIHRIHNAVGILNNGCAISPGNQRRKKTGYFDILLQ